MWHQYIYHAFSLICTYDLLGRNSWKMQYETYNKAIKWRRMKDRHISLHLSFSSSDIWVYFAFFLGVLRRNLKNDCILVSSLFLNYRYQISTGVKVSSFNAFIAEWSRRGIFQLEYELYLCIYINDRSRSFQHNVLIVG